MNKLRILFASAILLVCGNIYAQDSEFYSEIKSFMTDYRADYDQIVKAYFENQDLSLDDYTLLYYGYTFTDSYKPDYASNKADSLIDLKKYAEAYEVLKQEHKSDPTSLQTLFDLMGMAWVLEKSSEGQAFQTRYIKLMTAIIQACGDGSSKDNAIKVNRVTDEYQLLSTYFKAASVVKKEFTEDGIDKVTIKDSEGIVKDVYFDFSRYLQLTGK